MLTNDHCQADKRMDETERLIRVIELQSAYDHDRAPIFQNSHQSIVDTCAWFGEKRHSRKSYRES